MFPYIHIVLPSYGVLAFVGFFFSLLYLFMRKEKYSIEFGSFLKIYMCGGIGLLIGSKLLYAVTQIPALINDFSLKGFLLLIPNSGYVYYGGLLGTLAAVNIYIRKSEPDDKKNVFNWLAPAIPLFHVFGRIGCYLAGCCYGKDLAQPFEFFGLIRFNRIPTQLIEALFEMILFVLLMILGKKTKLSLVRVYLITYAALRFILEFFRGDDLRGIFFGLSTSQWMSVIVFLSLLFDAIIKKRAPKKSVNTVQN